ncbi:hypothetical protein Fmac_010274 [Flemingia macrophylla]|uniref:Uncharacterized protein n=1 Tax=Flemingia macrophylla TaxID=520843 RepID=A0ABD1MJ60_9FABA
MLRYINNMWSVLTRPLGKLNIFSILKMSLVSILTMMFNEGCLIDVLKLPNGYDPFPLPTPEVENEIANVNGVPANLKNVVARFDQNVKVVDQNIEVANPYPALEVFQGNEEGTVVRAA